MEENLIKALVCKGRAGDKKSIHELWQGLEQLRENWIRKTYLNNWGKEDLRQQSYLVLVESLEKYDEVEGMTFPAYYRMRLHIWKSKQMKRKGCESSNVESIERQMMNHAVEADTFFAKIENQSVLQEVMAALERLPNEEREFFVDSIIRQLSYQELSKKYDVKVTSISSKRKRILDKIRKQIL